LTRRVSDQIAIGMRTEPIDQIRSPHSPHRLCQRENLDRMILKVFIYFLIVSSITLICNTMEYYVGTGCESESMIHT
jgi:hypothetical protein